MSEGKTLQERVPGGRHFVLTADQRDSRHHADAVPDALALLTDAPTSPEHGLPFERAAGDEVQGLVTSGAEVVELVGRLLRSGTWRIGIGIGPVEEPLPASVREARGPAFIAARRAVERSHRTPQPVALDANTTVDRAAEELDLLLRAEGALWLWSALLTRRTDEGWEVVDAMATAPTQRAVAADLGVSPSAVSQRLRAAGWAEDERARLLCAALLDDAWDACATLGGPEPSDEQEQT
ncbi:hypothetical protein [Kytococcus sp. Marseille-QA3725]